VITRASAKCALGAKFDDQTGSACPKAEESKVEPSVSTQSGSLHFNVDNGKTMYLHRRAAKTIDVMQLADRVEAVEESQKKVGPVVDDRLADVRKALAETVDASTKTFLDKTLGALTDVRDETKVQAAKLASTLESIDKKTLAHDKNVKDQLAANDKKLVALDASVKKAVKGQTDSEVALKKQLEAATGCAAKGQPFDFKTGKCQGKVVAEGFGKPDWESKWVLLREGKGDASYLEMKHNLNADPALVRVVAVARREGDKYDGYSVDGMGGAICDGKWKGQGSCDGYGGFVFGYDNTRVRLWLPSQSSAQIMYPADGWGNERWGWSTKGRFNVYFKAVVWKEFAGKKADFDQKLAMEAGGSKSNTYKELKHNFGEYPDHVLVTAEAQSGPNKGFKFYSRGASVVDDDHNKYYAGLASAYDSTRVRLWTPSTQDGNPNGYIIMTGTQNWGGNKEKTLLKKALIRVRAWKPGTVAKPDVVTSWVRMCGYTSAYQSPEYSNPSITWHHFGHEANAKGMKEALPLDRPKGQGRPIRLVAQTRPYSGNNKGFIFECIGGGGDDEFDNGGNCYFVHTNDMGVILAPTRSNAASARRFVAINDGWGMGQMNTAENCAEARVMAWFQKE